MDAPPKKSANKWLVGLGIGCGGIVVIIIVLVIGGYLFVRNATQGFRESDELMKSVAAKYGRAEDYCPDPGGAIPSGRLETFLAVREAAASARAKVEESLEALMRRRDGAGGRDRSPGSVFQAMKTGIGMVPQISEYLKARAQALLDKGMGGGEYDYLYVIAYYSWLRKTPMDGAGFQFLGPGRDTSDPDDQDALAVSKDMHLMRIHRLVLPMLQCQLAKLGPAGKAGTGDKWRETLAAEVKAMEADRYRLPWQDGAPAEIDVSLRPFRNRLEASFGRMADLFEVATDRQLRQRGRRD
ncbi:MAG TPA: hypothetical protein VMS75_12030 [Terriglobales bacterium]|nr:hypothetical protein [Terriglobales bacterium]